MALIARLQHPFIVEFKEAWVEKVSSCIACSIFICAFVVLFLLKFCFDCRAAMFALSLDTVKAGICECPPAMWAFFSLSFPINRAFCLTMDFMASNRAELMKRSNGTYFPEEVAQ